MTSLDPAGWQVWTCSCGAVERTPYVPPDKLCEACRAGGDEARLPEVCELLRRAGAPRRYARLTRASWKEAYGPWSEHAAMRRLVDWTGSGPEWLVLIYGPAYGQRKTGAATALLGEQLARGRRGVWIDQADWIRRLRAGWSLGKGVAAEEEVYRRAAHAEVLLLDDIGAVSAIRDAAYWREQCAELLRHREAEELPTIVTANLSSWTDVAKIHPSLVSRCDVRLKIKFSGERDHRREKAADES